MEGLAPNPTDAGRSLDLPDGAFVVRDGAAWIVHAATLARWTPGGDADVVERPRGQATVITPETSLAVLRAGWDGAVPLLHPILIAGKAGEASGA